MIALGGICLALTLAFLFAGSVAPGIELTLFALSSLFTAVMLLESGVGAAALLYAAGIFKFYVEKLHSGILQVIIKAAFFAAVLCTGLLGFKKLLLGSIHLPDYPVWILIIAGILMMLVYDYIYTLCISFYLKRIRRKGADNMKLS